MNIHRQHYKPEPKQDWLDSIEPALGYLIAVAIGVGLAAVAVAWAVADSCAPAMWCG